MSKEEWERRKAAFRVLVIREKVHPGDYVSDIITRDEFMEVWNFAKAQAEFLLFGESPPQDPQGTE